MILVPLVDNENIMSIALIKISDNYLPVVKKIMKALNAKMHVMDNETEYEKKLMLQLLEESDESDEVPEEIIKSDFKK